MPIEMTERAAEEVKALFKQHNLPESTVLRVGVKGGGCSGFSYTLDLAEKPADNDKQFDINGLHLVCDPKSYLYLNGVKLDYKEELMQKGFVFLNPNAKSACGCGSSFNA